MELTSQSTPQANFILNMLFTSFNFLIFLAVAVIVNYILPQRWRVCWLLIASYYFYYALQPKYLLLLLFVTLLTYGGGQMLAKSKREKRKHHLLVLLSGILLGELFLFKYYNFVRENCNLLLGSWIDVNLPALPWLLPIGISFFTFQSLGYLTDVAQGKYVPEKRFCHLALYVSFFPIILSGPIERGAHLLPQLDRPASFSTDNLVRGGRLMLWGYFLKLVIAERLFAFTDIVFCTPQAWSSETLWLGCFLYPLGLYADFSGYSLIAIGSAAMFGIAVLENFQHPFVAETIPGFWRRWHMTLTSWLTDYLYTPLSIAWRNAGIWATAGAGFIVFLAVGIWHGASWNYIVFGCVHGTMVAGSALLQKRRKKFEKKHNLKNAVWYKIMCICATYTLIMLAFVLFRTSSLTHALKYYQGLLASNGNTSPSISNVIGGIILMSTVILLLGDFCQEFLDFHPFSHKKRSVRWICYILVFLTMLLFGKFGESSFVYFQF